MITTLDEIIEFMRKQGYAGLQCQKLKISVKLKLFALKPGSNFRFGSLGVIEDFKNWLGNS